MKKKVYIRTFGCQMNVRDSEVITGLLIDHHFTFTPNQNDAEIILFNTCSVRQHPENKVWSEIGRIMKIAKKRVGLSNVSENTKPIIGIIGCMAQNYKNEIFKLAPTVDIVCGTNDIHKLPGTIETYIVQDDGQFASF